MLDAVPYWLHLIGAAAWVGPQLMMFLVVAPGLGALDAESRVRLLARVTVRFGWLGAGALALLVFTGIDNIDRLAPGRMFDYRYGYILVVKIALAGVIVLLMAAHSLRAGPALLRLQEAALGGGVDEGALSKARRRSVMLSSMTLLLSLGVLFCAALLRSRWAFGAA
jgi:putative copper export protein